MCLDVHIHTPLLKEPSHPFCREDICLHLGWIVTTFHAAPALSFATPPWAWLPLGSEGFLGGFGCWGLAISPQPCSCPQHVPGAGCTPVPWHHRLCFALQSLAPAPLSSSMCVCCVSACRRRSLPGLGTAPHRWPKPSQQLEERTVPAWCRSALSVPCSGGWWGQLWGPVLPPGAFPVLWAASPGAEGICRAQAASDLEPFSSLRGSSWGKKLRLSCRALPLLRGCRVLLHGCSQPQLLSCNYAIRLSSAIIPQPFWSPVLNKVHLQSI